MRRHDGLVRLAHVAGVVHLRPRRPPVAGVVHRERVEPRLGEVAHPTVVLVVEVVVGHRRHRAAVHEQHHAPLRGRTGLEPGHRLGRRLLAQVEADTLALVGGHRRRVGDEALDGHQAVFGGGRRRRRHRNGDGGDQGESGGGAMDMAPPGIVSRVPVQDPGRARTAAHGAPRTDARRPRRRAGSPRDFGPAIIAARLPRRPGTRYDARTVTGSTPGTRGETPRCTVTGGRRRIAGAPA